MTRITVVVDNQAGPSGLRAEWGLALWIEHQGRDILYDTGGGQALVPNLLALELDPARLHAVVLSHGHHDHIGGLASLLLARGAPTEVWCHPSVFEAHYKMEGEGLRDIGAPLGRAAYEDRGAIFRFVGAPAQPWPGARLLAPVPRRTSYEEPAPGLVTLLGSSPLPDPVEEDLAMLLETAAGPVLVTGCAHAGVVNILMQAHDLLGRAPAWLVGGLHLDRNGAYQRDAALGYLGGLRDIRVAAGHCTGDKACAELAQSLGARFRGIHAGLRLEF